LRTEDRLAEALRRRTVGTLRTTPRTSQKTIVECDSWQRRLENAHALDSADNLIGGVLAAGAQGDHARQRTRGLAGGDLDALSVGPAAAPLA
jgi:hypothetical protein